jgi:hypothetical protein
MKKIKFIIFGILILFISFISSQGEYSFYGGDGSYLISQVNGDIQNSPFRYIESEIKVFGITGKLVYNIISNDFKWGIIPLIIIIIILLIIFKKKKSKKKEDLKKEREKHED